MLPGEGKRLKAAGKRGLYKNVTLTRWIMNGIKPGEWRDRAMTVPEVAKYMGVGRRIVYDLIDWGELTAIKQDGAIWVDRWSVDAFRSSGKLT